MAGLIIATVADQADEKRMSQLRRQAEASGAELLVASTGKNPQADKFDRWAAETPATVPRTRKSFLANLDAIARGDVRLVDE